MGINHDNRNPRDKLELIETNYLIPFFFAAYLSAFVYEICFNSSQATALPSPNYLLEQISKHPYVQLKSHVMAPPSLLLLTPPPSTFDKAALRAAYLPPLEASLIALSNSGIPQDSTAVLDIVVPCPHLASQSTKPRSTIFKDTQHLLAGLYALVGFIAAEQTIELDGPGGIDARILLLEDSSEKFEGEVKNRQVTGPIIDLGTLALTRKEWKFIFTVQSETGQGLFNSYRSLANPKSPTLKGEVKQVPGGTTITNTIHPTPVTRNDGGGSEKTHQVVAVGGTFDHLHTGHKLLLTATALVLQPPLNFTPSDHLPLRFIVGITGDELLVNKKHAEFLESWDQREQNVINFLIPLLSFSTDTKADVERIRVNEDRVNGQGVVTLLKAANVQIECVVIQDPFGPTITDASVSALVVSGETRDGGKAVNDKRIAQGWEGLETFEIDVLDEKDEVGEGKEGVTKTENYAAKISSSVIRQRRAEKAKQTGRERKPSPSNL